VKADDNRRCRDWHCLRYRLFKVCTSRRPVTCFYRLGSVRKNRFTVLKAVDFASRCMKYHLPGFCLTKSRPRPKLFLKSTNHPCGFDPGRGAASAAPVFLGCADVRTFVYIDGFNFYYRAVKGTPYKWLDFKKLFQNILQPHHNILSIKYFTALVSGKIDPDQPIRQKTFIRALEKHIPELSVYYGTFMSHPTMQPMVCPIDKCLFGRDIKFVNIIKTEEKGSDVNMAVHLLNDAWLDAYDCAVVVSNDSDLAESLKTIKNQLHKKIGLITPGNTHPSKELMQYADFNKHVRNQAMAASQLPNPIPGSTIHKPLTW